MGDEANVTVLVLFALYLLAVLGASLFAYASNRRAIAAAKKDAGPENPDRALALEQHFLGGRSLGRVVTVLTLAGTVYSGYSLIAVPADFGRNGFVGVRWFGNTVSVQFGALALAPRLRRLGLARRYVSPLAFVQDRFRSPPLSAFAVVATVVPALFFLAAQVISLRDTIATAFSGTLNPDLTTLGCCGLIVAYEWFGGMTSVAWTDVLQGAVMTLGTVGGAVLIACTWGGLEGAAQTLARARPQFYAVPSGESQMAMFAYAAGASAFFVNAFCITRVYAAKHYSSVRLAMCVIAAMEFVIKLPGMLLGVQGAARMPAVEPSQIFSAVSLALAQQSAIATILMSALLVAAMAAIMSTADSSLMALTNVAASDVLDRRLSHVPEHAFKLLSLVAMVAAVGLSYLFTDLTLLFVLQNSLLMVGVAPLFALGLYVPTMHAGVVLVSTAAGVCVAVGLTFGLRGDDEMRLLQLAGNMVGLGVLLCVAYVLHALQRRSPLGALSRALDAIAFGLRRTPDRAHRTEFDAAPLHVPALLHGLREPLSGVRGRVSIGLFCVCEALFVPWYVRTGGAEARVLGVPAWAAIAVGASGVGAAVSVWLWSGWRDESEEEALLTSQLKEVDLGRLESTVDAACSAPIQSEIEPDARASRTRAV